MLGESCSVLLSSLMLLMDTPATPTRATDRTRTADTPVTRTADTPLTGTHRPSDRTYTVPAGTRTTDTQSLATSYSLRASRISISSSNERDGKSMTMFFRPIEADNCVRHLLALVGLVYNRYPPCPHSNSLPNPNPPPHPHRNDISNPNTRHDECSEVDENLMNVVLNLPQRYYLEDRFRAQLMPALESIYEGRETELETVVEGRLLSFQIVKKSNQT